uniref:Preprotein translocase subunit SECE1 isoform X2 n=1 Tax=Nicotiana tabacum TaxID=4097 RepID=A0A1S3YLN1_TOBAC|nr:PREDICTED: preprotein translocase subunit SECE1-like isoform X2 [Nicotiana tabacum]
MAHTLSFSQSPLPLPSSSPKFLHLNTTASIKPTPIFSHLKKQSLFTSTPKKPNSFTIPLKATQESNSNNSSSETQQNPPPDSTKVATDQDAGGDELSPSDVGSEIKKLMKEREEKGTDFWSGVAEEIREIEWPAFGKVLSTTGVVIGVIAGSSVVLLTVNAVLAELSDRVFVGKGVQDFFG